MEGIAGEYQLARSEFAARLAQVQCAARAGRVVVEEEAVLDPGCRTACRDGTTIARRLLVTRLVADQAACVDE